MFSNTSKVLTTNCINRGVEYLYKSTHLSKIFYILPSCSFFTYSSKSLEYQKHENCLNKKKLLRDKQVHFTEVLSYLHINVPNNGRYGHRLVKLWEQKEYTIDPLKVYRTGGRLPTENWKGEVVPGRVWTAKLGGGLPRVFHWVERQRLTAEDVRNEVLFQEKIIKIIEDDNRSGHIALVSGPWKRRWVLCTQDMKVGDFITNSARPLQPGDEMKDGDAYPLKYIQNGTKVCFVEFRPGKGGQIARSAGAYCTVLRKTDTRVILMMPSKREIHVDLNCVAVIGAVSNPEHKDEVWGSAQQVRRYGIRPSSGCHHKRDGRYAPRGLDPLPPVVIKQEEILQKNNQFEE